MQNHRMRDKRELTPAEQRSDQRLLIHVDQEREDWHRRALKAAWRVYQLNPEP
jgi:hypothetical protein